MREHGPDAGQTARGLDRLTGAILDSRYRISHRLAEGGFGAIYQATDLVMGREVALKVLHRELAADPNVVARFRREAEALARLRDQHTITMYDVGVAADGTHYIVMELLRGESLYEQFRAHGQLPWRRVAAIARGVCSSLREAHAVGIVHRDLKPANIHLEVSAMERDFVKVLDFGIAKLIDADNAGPDLTLAGQMIGTFDYMPPEQLVGGMCTGRSDVFTLAVVIYEMIAGQRPFGEVHGPAGRLMAILTTMPAPLADRARVDVPPELDALVMRALSRDPGDRMDVEEFDETLARILDATSVIAVRATTPAPHVASPPPDSDIGALIDEVVAGLDAIGGTQLAEGTVDEEPRLAEGTVDEEARFATGTEDTERFDDEDDETWVGAPPQMTTIGLAPTRPPSEQVPLRRPADLPARPATVRFAVGSRTKLPPVKTPSPPPAEQTMRQPLRRTPSNLVDTSSAGRTAKAREVATAHAHAHDSQGQTARQATPPVIRMKPPATGNPVWISGRPTPSDVALPPAPRLTPSGQLPQLPMRMATGTSPIVYKAPSTPVVRYLVWAVALFGVGFAAALGLAAL